MTATRYQGIIRDVVTLNARRGTIGAAIAPTIAYLTRALDPDA